MQTQLESILTAFNPYLVPVLAGVLLLNIAAAAIQRRRNRRNAERLAYAERMAKLVQPEAGLENNLNLILEVFGSVVEAYGYAFYVRSGSTGPYVLKAVRHRREDLGKVEPSYSGLAPYKKEVYQPPLSVTFEAKEPKPGIIREGEVPLLNLPIEGGKGLIRIGPIAKVGKETLDLLAFITGLLPRTLDVLAESDRLALKADVVETSSNALQAISSMAKDSESVIRKVYSMSASALGMSGGCSLVSEAGRVDMPLFFGWGKETGRRLSDAGNVTLLLQLIGTKDLVFWEQGNDKFEQIASLLGLQGTELLVGGMLPIQGKRAWYICSFPKAASAELTLNQLKDTARVMIRQLTQLIRIQGQMDPFSQTYADFLKLLAATIDNLNPYTVGYSEMMSRYSIIIAKEMGLSPQQIRNIGIAAHLSNIGVLGLSEELYLKEGKFTEVEFEKMKLHTDVGAAIVEMTMGSKEIADSIRYHHERVDGNGYPFGLRGEEIPVGARIISVVQTFLAKINGRKYRDPLPFDKALKLLESLSGTQLDAQVVNTLVRWFEAKRKGPILSGRALGACWEMCCTPSDICRSCPAYNQTRLNCFEFETNNCQAHGKSCQTCFVYTETLTRRESG